jgi:predicted AAA+ superfamily ATPase
MKSYLLCQKALKKSVMKRLAKNSEEILTIIIEDLMEQFVESFNLLHSKERNGQKYNVTHKEETT